MPDYTKVRSLLSHRVIIEYDTGATVTGYLTKCLPAEGPVQLVHIANAVVVAKDGAVLERSPDLRICPNALTGIRGDEGPRGRDL